MKRIFFIAAMALFFSCPALTAKEAKPTNYVDGEHIVKADTMRVEYDSHGNHLIKIDTLREVKLEQIQVTATRADSKTPMAHTEIKKEEIAKMNFGQDIPFLLTLTPSVVATSDAGAGIGYTGVRIRGVDASRISVTSNGVPLNDAESHSLFWVNMPDFASSVEDIQVQRGVGTSTNGSGAFGGSINMQTESLSRTPYAEASLSYGSYNTHREQLKVNTGLIKNRWAFGARLSNLHSDGYIDRASTDQTSYFAQGAYYGKNTVVKLITFGGKEKTYHAWDGISASQLAENRRYNPCGRIEDVVRNPDGTPVFNPDGSPETKITGFYNNQTDNYVQTHYQAIVNQKLGLQWNLTATLHYTKGDGYYEEYKNAATYTDYGLKPWLPADPSKEAYLNSEGYVKKSNLIRRKMMDNNFGGAVLSVNYSSEKLTASFGGAANHYSGDHFGQVMWVKNYVGDLLPEHEYYRNHSTKDDANIFARANYNVAKGLNIYGDLQYRYIHHTIKGPGDKWNWIDDTRQMLDVDNTYNFFNPKVGVFYDINKQNNIYASFAVAHKEPTRNNFTDAMFGTTPKSERLFDYELGYKYSGGIFAGGVNLYYMDYKDQLVLTGRVNDIGEPMSDNVAKSFRAGIELTAGVKITNWLRWDVNATFSRNRILDYTEYVDDYVDVNGVWNSLGTQTAVNIGNTDIAYSPSIIAGSLITFSVGDFSAAFQSQYVGSQYVTNSMQNGIKQADGEWELAPLKLDDYFVNNLRLNYSFHLPAMRSIDVGLAVNNIFNAMYCSNGWGYSMLVSNEAGTSSSRSNDMGYFPQAGINFIASVSFKF